MNRMIASATVILVGSPIVAAACSQSSVTPQPVVVAAPPPATRSQEPVTQETEGNPSTGRIRCGDQICDATTQVCCGFSGEQGCAQRVAMDAGKDQAQAVQPIIASCEQHVESEYSFDSLLLCDDSTDCPDGQICCSQWLWSGASMLACMPASETGEQVCDYHERCSGETCRTPLTHCVQSECRRKDVRVLCAGNTCEAGAPFCCQRDFNAQPKCEVSCEPANEQDRVFEFACSDSSHCPPGAYCQAGMFGSYCATKIDVANSVTLCASDADCPRDGCAWLGQSEPPKCVEGPRPGLKACSCG